MAVVLRPGDSNDLVRLLQARLNRDYPLYSNLVVDGIYAPRTTAVVREFQRRAGLVVDGVGAFLIRNPQIHYNDWPASTGSPVSTARCRLSRRARRAVCNPIMEACGTTGGRFQPASSAGLLWSGPFSWPRYI